MYVCIMMKFNLWYLYKLGSTQQINHPRYFSGEFKKGNWLKRDWRTGKGRTHTVVIEIETSGSSFHPLEQGIKGKKLGLTDLEVWGSLWDLDPDLWGGADADSSGTWRKGPWGTDLWGGGAAWLAWSHLRGMVTLVWSVKRSRELESIPLGSQWANNSKISWQIGRSKFLLPPPAFPVGRT